MHDTAKEISTKPSGLKSLGGTEMSPKFMDMGGGKTGDGGDMSGQQRLPFLQCLKQVIRYQYSLLLILRTYIYHTQGERV